MPLSLQLCTQAPPLPYALTLLLVDKQIVLQKGQVLPAAFSNLGSNCNMPGSKIVCEMHFSRPARMNVKSSFCQRFTPIIIYNALKLL